MNYLEIIKEYHKIEERARFLASQYANGVMDCGGSLYSGITFTGQCFSFQYGPSTHGLSFSGKLPTGLLSSENWSKELADIIENDKAKSKADRERATCKTCGHVEIQHYGGKRF